MNNYYEEELELEIRDFGEIVENMCEKYLHTLILMESSLCGNGGISYKAFNVKTKKYEDLETLYLKLYPMVKEYTNKYETKRTKNTMARYLHSKGHFYLDNPQKEYTIEIKLNGNEIIKSKVVAINEERAKNMVMKELAEKLDISIKVKE